MHEKYFDLSFDGICIYINIAVKNPLLGKIALVLAELFILVVFFIAVINWIPGLVLMSFFFLLLLMKYSLWNFFGQENLIINTKTISYRYDYGFFRTTRVTKKLSKPVFLHYENCDVIDDEFMVKLQLISNDKDDLPEIIYQFALPVSLQEAQQIDSLIRQISIQKVTDDYSLPDINLN